MKALQFSLRWPRPLADDHQVSLRVCATIDDMVRVPRTALHYMYLYLFSAWSTHDRGNNLDSMHKAPQSRLPQNASILA